MVLLIKNIEYLNRKIFLSFFLHKTLLVFLNIKNLFNVAMRMEAAFYNIYMYLHNKNVLEYAQIARSEPKSMILNFEGRSIE